MKTRMAVLLPALLVGGSLLLCAPRAQALYMVAEADYVVSDYYGGGLVDNGSDSSIGASGSVSASVDFNYASYQGGRAGAYGDQSGAMAAHAGYMGVDSNLYYFAAGSSWSETFMNTASEPVPYTFDFAIPEVVLGIADYCSGCGINTARYEIAINLDGTRVWDSSMAITLDDSGTLNFSWDGTDLGLSAETDPNYIFNAAYYVSTPYSGSLALGDFDAGDSFTLSYTMEVRASGPGFERGAVASIGDPFTLSGTMTGTVSNSPGAPAPVPEPATLLLLGTGLAGVAGIRRRRPGRTA